MIDALYELVQAILMMAFIGGSIWVAVFISEYRKSFKRHNRYVTRHDHNPIDREPYSKNFSRMHRDWRKM